MNLFIYSYEACFKGEIVLTGTVADHPSNRRIVQSTKTTLLTYPILLFLRNTHKKNGIFSPNSTLCGFSGGIRYLGVDFLFFIFYFFQT